ncbi:TetR/AcrR family transcriptional regulator [Nonomuraea sp. NPDC052116]|uniref:TetR/AcrR family transcriptional regulator n=1 Tax=Nonomuraea sp. NPDC052116 TaxID=3155665 RepID=UPI0034244F6C
MSRAAAEEHKRQVIDNTSRLIRERGADQVSVPQAMAAAGLTHGGFYRHFSSKDDLIAQAITAAFAERSRAMEQLVDQVQAAGAHSAERSARTTYLATYLSELHRDHPAKGCAAAGLVVDAARAEPGAPVRTAFTAGLRNLFDDFQRLDDNDDADTNRSLALAELSTLVGALLLARASDDAALSRDILDAARQYLNGRTGDSP